MCGMLFETKNERLKMYKSMDSPQFRNEWIAAFGLFSRCLDESKIRPL